ncbi:MAG: hypothetical protein O3B43_06595 [Chloroflexi bacterium]|nr:hypothetical protein [Chloroflexota bacterium]
MLNRIKKWLEKQYVIFYKKRPVLIPDLILPHPDDLSPEALNAVNTVVPFIGPYRNLTTLLSLLLYFHPNVHVLNHADNWVLDYPDFNFLRNPSPPKMETFKAFALTHYHPEIGEYWHRFITRSHAMRDPARSIQRNRLIKRFGMKINKTDVRTIVWKGALNTPDELMHGEHTLDELLSTYPSLRFILPIRNPLDCALSNFKIKNARVTINAETLEQTLNEVMEIFTWGLKAHQAHPDKVFVLYQDEINPATLGRLANFLQVPPNKQWTKDFLYLFRIGKSKPHSPNLLRYYKDLVNKSLSWSPEDEKKMLAFADSAQAPPI